MKLEGHMQDVWLGSTCVYAFGCNLPHLSARLSLPSGTWQCSRFCR